MIAHVAGKQTLIITTKGNQKYIVRIAEKARYIVLSLQKP